LQIAKHFFSKTGITRRNGLFVPARYRRDRPSQESHITSDVWSLKTTTGINVPMTMEEKEIQVDMYTKDKRVLIKAENWKPYTPNKK
jgi:hypothetical protein